MSKTKRLIQFDFDSTLIQQEVIDLIAAKAGVETQVARITEQAMCGEIDFAQSLQMRVGLLKGLPAKVLEVVQSELRLTDGVVEVVDTLHRRGHHVTVVSGGFTDVIAPTLEKLSIKYFKANKLEILDGVLTGNLVGDIVDGQKKADMLIEFAATLQVQLEDTVTVGDGANDLIMMGISGVSVAYNAKPIVIKVADFSITQPTMKPILEILGIS